MHDIDTLLTLLGLPGPGGNEAPVADWISDFLQNTLPDAARIRVADNLLVVRGEPTVAVFAHLDTVGFTLGHENVLLPIGGAQPDDRVLLRCTSFPATGTLRFRKKGRGTRLKQIAHPVSASLLGTRWIYAATPHVDANTITAPFLDNRTGVWCALQALRQCENIAVAFTTGEEQHGHGARVCGHYLHEKLGISRALIADLTWHTPHTPCGSGAVISLRDAYCPRQAFLDTVLCTARDCGILFQPEVQGGGSSDGGHLLRSAIPMDWVFVGAPQRHPHTSREQMHLGDLEALRDLLIYLMDRLPPPVSGSVAGA